MGSFICLQHKYALDGVKSVCCIACGMGRYIKLEKVVLECTDTMQSSWTEFNVFFPWWKMSIDCQFGSI
jgi:hypothetical protein